VAEALANHPPGDLSHPARPRGAAASLTRCRDNVIRAILFSAGVLLILFLCSEEFDRAQKWLRARLRSAPRYRLIVYPLLLLVIVAVGIIIVTSLIEFSKGHSFSYD
jgi:hypothetical protein